MLVSQLNEVGKGFFKKLSGPFSIYRLYQPLPFDSASKTRPNAPFPNSLRNLKLESFVNLGLSTTFSCGGGGWLLFPNNHSKNEEYQGDVSCEDPKNKLK